MVFKKQPFKKNLKNDTAPPADNSENEFGDSSFT